MTIGAARRLGTTETILVVLRGSRVPFYINYEGCTLRCLPFRLKVEACTRCRKIGHRQDVCPSTLDSICHKCGLKDSPMDHECEPICVVCGGAHLTGSPLCKQRYKTKTPKSQIPSKPTHASSSRTPSLHRSQDRGQQRSRSRSKKRGPNSTPKELAFPTQSTNPHPTGPLQDPLTEESLGDSVLTLNDRINALENKTQNRFAVIESKISHIESRFTALENGQTAINEKLDKFLDFVQAHMQQTTAWIAAVTANNPNIAIPTPSPTPPPDHGCKPSSL
ncbi:hypothetical protein HPB52_002160 [Rhipicephalus sanguineus]|uniref:CCHC-type domain-containing protein n=1 Tax=Rhipicephalus sanguineus TaxID=34632 RepID=A0A9D4T2I5_RHISA|nr:hypothetical protein HPB52_002160 [Rhipicephalus sanguineus]